MGAPTASQHNIFYSEKNSHQFVLCCWRGWNLGSLGLGSDALSIEPPRHPICCLTWCFRELVDWWFVDNRWSEECPLPSCRSDASDGTPPTRPHTRSSRSHLSCPHTLTMLCRLLILSALVALAWPAKCKWHHSPQLCFFLLFFVAFKLIQLRFPQVSPILNGGMCIK